MLHPNQFQVDEAWIAFRLNDVPLRTEQGGSFNVFALMDAASCFILGAEFVATGKAEPSLPEIKRLLKGAQRQSNGLPVTLFLPQGQFEKIFPAEAERRGISVVRVDESQLLTFIGEARRGFQERFSMFVKPNYQLQRTGRFLRFSGHPELTIQEGSHAKTRTKDDESL